MWQYLFGTTQDSVHTIFLVPIVLLDARCALLSLKVLLTGKFIYVFCGVSACLVMC